MRRLTGLLLILGVLSGCNGFVDPSTYVVRTGQPLAQAPATHARVVLIWSDTRNSKRYNMPVYEDEVLVGALRAQSYFVHLTEPGAHVFATLSNPRFNREESQGIKTVAGETYYLLFTYTPNPNFRTLTRISEAEAHQHLNGLKQTQMVKAPSLVGWPEDTTREVD